MSEERELKLKIILGNNVLRTRVVNADTGDVLPVTHIVIEESVKGGSLCTITFPLTNHIVTCSPAANS